MSCDSPSAPVPRPRPRIRGQEMEGGHSCEFVTEPPDFLQAKCPICLLILRTPHQVTCCGYSFCKSCIECVLKRRDACPLCNNTDFSTYSNIGLERSLREFKVYCSNRNEGCAWTGELGDLDDHLSPNGRSRKSGMCGFIRTSCTFCGASIFYHSLDKHQTSECSLRPYSCAFCDDYTTTFADVTETHWKECPGYPITCPNSCGSSFTRQELDQHLTSECPYASVSCDFHSVGCKAQSDRGRMGTHLTDKLAEHMALLSTHMASHTGEVESFVPLLARSVEKLAVMHQELRRENENLSMKYQELRRENEHLRQSYAQLKRDQEKQLLRLDNVTLTGQLPVEFTVPNCNFPDLNWMSKSFYTHSNGYKMCLNCCISPTHDAIQVMACLMRGEFDDTLVWPFHGSLTVQLLNQINNDHHHTRTFNFYEATDPKITDRVVLHDRAANGWGEKYFFKYTDLGYNRHLQRQYLVNDCLKFRVVKVTNIGPIARLERKSLQFEMFTQALEQQVPIEFTLNHFTQLQENNTVIYSPMFYTHKKGYKMCLKILPNTTIDGTAYVSVFSHLLPGPYDTNLRWPFCGMIVVEVVNQLQDDQHYKMKISYKGQSEGVAGPMVNCERSGGLGFSEFISHKKLEKRRNCQYLRNNCIRIRVSSVNLRGQ